MHADGCDFSWRIILRPHAGKAGNTLSDYAQVTAGSDKHFFQLADKIDGADPRLKGTEIENGIADELARAVKGDITAAVGIMQLNSVGGQRLTRSDDVLGSGIAAQSDDRRVFQQDQGVGDAPFFDQ